MGERGGRPERLGDILARVLKDRGLLSERRQLDLIEAWTEVAGPHVAPHTKVISFRAGVLTVAVDSAPLRQELELFQREGLLDRLRERFKKTFVDELRFRLV